VDSFDGRTVLLRVGEIAMIAVLNDSGAVQTILHDSLRCLKGPLSSIQLRELMVRMAFTNIHLLHRPKFSSSFERTYYNPDVPAALCTRI
jgi:hypothetical protein